MNWFSRRSAAATTTTVATTTGKSIAHWSTDKPVAEGQDGDMWFDTSAGGAPRVWKTGVGWLDMGAKITANEITADRTAFVPVVTQTGAHSASCSDSGLWVCSVCGAESMDLTVLAEVDCDGAL